MMIILPVKEWHSEEYTKALWEDMVERLDTCGKALEGDDKAIVDVIIQDSNNRLYESLKHLEGIAQ